MELNDAIRQNKLYKISSNLVNLYDNWFSDQFGNENATFIDLRHQVDAFGTYKFGEED